MWAAQAARLGVKWHVGDGRRVRFWEDQWFGSCSLAIQYWDLYSIINEQGCTIREAWDGTNLKFTFRRTVNKGVMLLWQELLQIASEICFSEEPDQMIWQFSSTGRYSVQTLYAVVNDRGVRQIFTPVVWKIKVPPRIHIFLWLFARNKLLTRDNLAKRRKLDDQSCLFCSDNESVHHLFFYCCVARQMWYNIAEILELPVGQKFESIARLWLCDKKYKLVNICTSAALWALWKTRNDILFQVASWIGMRRVLARCAKSIMNWKVLMNPEEAGKLEQWAEDLERRSAWPPRIEWTSLQQRDTEFRILGH
jgi:hypothetical protein